MKLIVRPRLHLGLISMHSRGVRKNGGIGFAIQEPSGILEIQKSTSFSFEDVRPVPFADAEINQLRTIVEAVAGEHSLRSSIHVRLRGALRTHVGMGSGTAVRLGVLEALFLSNDASISRHELISRSLRGGTSGIGINTYFSGGLLLDLGVPDDKAGFAPSSSARNVALPLSLCGVPLAKWPLCLCVPRFLSPKSQQEEIEFFSRSTPVAPASSFEAAYLALFGIYASAKEGNYSAFCRSIAALQKTQWKRQEWQEYGADLCELAEALNSLGATAVGMSSLGPMLYCFGSERALTAVCREAERINCDVIRTCPCNEGRTLLVE